MALKDWFEQSPSRASAAKGPLQIGWLLGEPKSGVLYYPPERVRSAETNKKHAKSASRCPAVINLESRHFLIRVPFDIQIAFVRNDKGEPGLRHVPGPAGSVRGSTLGKVLHVTREVEWRYPDRPTIQVSLPYVFICDETAYISQTAPFMHYINPPWPGTIFGGRFAVKDWPRPLMWAFEWQDISKPLVLKRGDPWFYITFEGEDPGRSISMVEAEKTKDLQDYMTHISSSVNYVSQSFSLMKEAARVRPETLLVPKNRA